MTIQRKIKEIVAAPIKINLIIVSPLLSIMQIDSSNPSLINISLQELQQFSEPILLIDVRSSVEYNLGHIPDAVNLNLFNILIGSFPFLRRWLLPKWFQDLPKNRPIAVICLSAHRSPIAAKKLLKMGFSNVYNIEGGMLAWWKLQPEKHNKCP
jgi:rhodanese-related sulfurtransferase